MIPPCGRCDGSRVEALHWMGGSRWQAVDCTACGWDPDAARERLGLTTADVRREWSDADDVASWAEEDHRAQRRDDR